MVDNRGRIPSVKDISITRITHYQLAFYNYADIFISWVSYHTFWVIIVLGVHLHYSSYLQLQLLLLSLNIDISIARIYNLRIRLTHSTTYISITTVYHLRNSSCRNICYGSLTYYWGTIKIVDYWKIWLLKRKTKLSMILPSAVILIDCSESGFNAISTRVEFDIAVKVYYYIHHQAFLDYFKKNRS